MPAAPPLDAQLRKRAKEIEKIVAEATRYNVQATNIAAKEGANRVKELLSKEGSYKVTKYSWGEHWSSAPGDPPAKGRGTLYDSIVSGELNNGNPAVSFFGSNVRYSVYLEFGHGGPKPAAPRPFMRVVAGDPDFHHFITTTVKKKWEASIRRAVGRYAKVTVQK